MDSKPPGPLAANMPLCDLTIGDLVQRVWALQIKITKQIFVRVVERSVVECRLTDSVSEYNHGIAYA